MKTKRSLSGIYFRFQNPETNKYENWCFEDLPVEMQDKYLDGNSIEYLKSFVKQFADTLNEIGESLDITKEQP